MISLKALLIRNQAQIKNSMKNNSASKGQGLVETILTLPLLVLLMTGLTYLLYRGAIFYLSDYHLHEALICLQSSSVATCENELARRLKPIVFNSGIKIRLSKFHNSSQGEITVALKPPLQIKQTFKR